MVNLVPFKMFLPDFMFLKRFWVQGYLEPRAVISSTFSDFLLISGAKLAIGVVNSTYCKTNM